MGGKQHPGRESASLPGCGVGGDGFVMKRQMNEGVHMDANGIRLLAIK